MVKSGLVPEKYFVGHVELTTHLVAAIILLAYVFWFALKLMPSMQVYVKNAGTKSLTLLTSVVLFIQLVYGGFMAGLRAAYTAPTWPDINGHFYHPLSAEQVPFLSNMFNNPLMVHFIHRGLGYILFILAIVLGVRLLKNKAKPVRNAAGLLIVFTVLQVVLGIITLLTSTNKMNMIVWGVWHQLNAMCMVLCLTAIAYYHTAHKRSHSKPAV